jgi:hypothetical protein
MICKDNHVDVSSEIDGSVAPHATTSPELIAVLFVTGSILLDMSLPLIRFSGVPTTMLG